MTFQDLNLISKLKNQNLEIENQKNKSSTEEDNWNILVAPYTKALEVSSKINVVELKRKPNKCNINNYNGPVTLSEH